MKFGPPDILFLLATIGIMYFLFFLPQRRKQQNLQKMLGALKKGDRVVTHAGMHGEVFAIKDSLITLKFHDNARIDFDKSAISQVLSDKQEGKPEAKG